MRDDVFVSPEFGTPRRKPGDRWAFWYFSPKPLPREIPLSPESVYLLSQADAALGRLAGAGRLLPNPALLINPYLTQEAVSSTRIEGTETSLTEVFKATASAGETDDDVIEVENYVKAMWLGIERLRELPICLRLIKEIHKTLLQGARGKEKMPGEFRSSPVWIGSPTDSPETATYVPPLPGDELNESLADWEKFANEDLRMPTLIRCALLHYQFETIHPFLDGNGRLGRLLIVFFLMQQERISAPLLYISAYLERNRREYYDRLQAVRERGEMEEWIQFFLAATAKQAEESAQRTERLVDLREHYRAELAGNRSRAAEVVDLMFSNPIITARRVEMALKMTNQGARNLISGFEKRGWITHVGTFGRGGRAYWLASEIWSIIQPINGSD